MNSLKQRKIPLSHLNTENIKFRSGRSQGKAPGFSTAVFLGIVSLLFYGWFALIKRDSRINEEIPQLRIALGWSLFEVQEQSILQENMTESAMDIRPHYFFSPIQTSYILEDGDAIKFPPGRFLFFSSGALHITSISVSPQLSGTSEDYAFELASLIENQFLSAGLQENYERRTSHEEAVYFLQKRPYGYPAKIHLYQYTLGEVIFNVGITKQSPDNHVITVRISSYEIFEYWSDVAFEIAEKVFGESDLPVGMIDAEEYMHLLEKHGYLNGN